MFFLCVFFLTHLNFNRKWNFRYLWLTSVSVSCISPICLETMTCSRQDFAIIHNISGSTWRSWCNMNALLCVRLCYELGPKNMTVTWMETNKFAFHDVAAHDFHCNGIAWNSNSQTAERIRKCHLQWTRCCWDNGSKFNFVWIMHFLS